MAGLTSRQLLTIAENPALLEAILADPNFASVYEQAQTPLAQWRPRPDQPDIYDEQTAFVNSRAKFAVCVGGTGSGKTSAAAYKTALRVLFDPPPRPHCPFWIVGERYEMVGGICWAEKLSQFIPPDDIDYISWLNEKRQWPLAVILKTGWVLEFKSYMQGRSSFQGRSIGGFWLNEECPLSIVEEIRGRCRDYDSPGWADFTPLDKHSIAWAKMSDRPPPGWEFYNLNVRCNTALPAEWIEEFLAGIPEDMRATREHGAFAVRQGAVFKEFRRHLHLVEPFEIPERWHRIRAIDFGWNHPTACVWLARDDDHNYYVYDAYMESGRLLHQHAREIKARHEWPEKSPYHGRTFADGASAQEIAEFKRQGVVCIGARKSLDLGIECVRRLMMPQPRTKKPRLFIMETPNTEALITQIQDYHWETSVGTGDREHEGQDRPVKFNDDLVDALRYAIYSEEAGGMEPIIQYEKPVPVRKAWVRASRGFLVGG